MTPSTTTMTDMLHKWNALNLDQYGGGKKQVGGNNELIDAAENGDIDFVRELLYSGVDPNIQGEYGKIDVKNKDVYRIATMVRLAEIGIVNWEIEEGISLYSINKHNI